MPSTVWAGSHRERLREAANALDAVLEGAGLRILGGTALFRLAACAAPGELFRRLASQGILARPFKDRSALRFGLANGEEERSRLRHALQLA